jgi:hypothetical protein
MIRPFVLSAIFKRDSKTKVGKYLPELLYGLKAKENISFSEKQFKFDKKQSRTSSIFSALSIVTAIAISPIILFLLLLKTGIMIDAFFIFFSL